MKKEMPNEEKDMQIVELFKNGVPIVRIGEIVSRSTYDIQRVLRENNIVTRKKYLHKIEDVTDFEKARICRMYDNGVSIRNIVHIAKCSSDVLLKILAEKIIQTTKIEEIENIDGEKKPIDCDTQGKRCIYRATVARTLHYCDYLCQVGHSRGCDPKECTEYVMRKSRKINNI